MIVIVISVGFPVHIIPVHDKKLMCVRLVFQVLMDLLLKGHPVLADLFPGCCSLLVARYLFGSCYETCSCV